MEKGKNSFIGVRILVIAISLIMVAGICSQSFAGENSPPPLGKKKLVLLRPSWPGPSIQAVMSKMFLEKMGYEVDLKLVDTGIAYQALASGSGDIWGAAWLPGQQPYLNKYGDKLSIMGISYHPVPAGLVVPGYVPISNIEDLKNPEVKKKLKGKITGCDAGAGLMITTERVIREYGLDYELEPGSTASMQAAFRAAYEKKEWVIITGWCPLTMCKKYDIRFLEDDKRIYKKYADYHVVRSGFREAFPRASVFFSRFTLHEAQVSQMILWREEEKLSEEEVVKRFVEYNPALFWYFAGDLIPNYPKPAFLDAK